MYITHIPLCVPTIYMYKALNVDFLKCRSVHYFVIPLSIFFYIVLTNQKSNKTNLNWTWRWSVWRCNIKIVGPLRHSKSIFVHSRWNGNSQTKGCAAGYFWNYTWIFSERCHKRFVDGDSGNISFVGPSDRNVALGFRQHLCLQQY